MSGIWDKLKEFFSSGIGLIFGIVLFGLYFLNIYGIFNSESPLEVGLRVAGVFIIPLGILLGMFW